MASACTCISSRRARVSPLPAAAGSSAAEVRCVRLERNLVGRCSCIASLCKGAALERRGLLRSEASGPVCRVNCLQAPAALAGWHPAPSLTVPRSHRRPPAQGLTAPMRRPTLASRVLGAIRHAGGVLPHAAAWVPKVHETTPSGARPHPQLAERPRRDYRPWFVRYQRDVVRRVRREAAKRVRLEAAPVPPGHAL